MGESKSYASLRGLIQKIATADVTLYPSHDPQGLGFDYSFVNLTEDEIQTNASNDSKSI